jgi:hypothetical protein
MEDQVETEQDSTSHVAMLAGRGTFIAGTADGLGTVTQARHSTKRHRAAVNVSEDLLNRLIQDYGLVCPERAKNVVWFFFKKFGSKKVNGQDALLVGAGSPLHDLPGGPAAPSALHSEIGQRRFTVFVDGSHEDTSSGRIQCSGSCQ